MPVSPQVLAEYQAVFGVSADPAGLESALSALVALKGCGGEVGLRGAIHRAQEAKGKIHMPIRYLRESMQKRAAEGGRDEYAAAEQKAAIAQFEMDNTKALNESEAAIIARFGLESLWVFVWDRKARSHFFDHQRFKAQEKDLPREVCAKLRAQYCTEPRDEAGAARVRKLHAMTTAVWVKEIQAAHCTAGPGGTKCENCEGWK